MIEATPLDLFLDEIKDALPHGSGINGTWEIDRQYGDNVVWFSCSYDYMSDLGYYDGGFSFWVRYRYDFAARTAKYTRLWTDIPDFVVNGECGNCGGHHIKNCSECDGVGAYADGVLCYTCEGSGEDVCPDCDEEGNVKYDDLPDLLDYLDQCFWEEIKL